VNEQTFLAFSDTHGNIAALRAVLRWAGERGIGTAVFLGDGGADLAPAAAETGFTFSWKKVRGNGDGDPAVPETDVFDFCGHRFLLVHGHRCALYNGYGSLAASAAGIKAAAALFGHTHIPCLIDTGGVLLINPGSVGRPRSRAGASFATVECQPHEAPKVTFWGISPRGKIRELKI
jgi:putative phosphoesterase